MRCLNRNKQRFFYALYLGQIAEIVDSNGNYTGEFVPAFSAPVDMMANISPATGNSSTDMFGGLENYDKVIVTDWMDCPINEQTVLWIDKTPNDGEHDYIVRRVARSLNSISIAVSKVKVDKVVQQ